MNYKVAAVIALIVLAVLALGDGYMRTRRADRRIGSMKSRVSGMSVQQLARAVAECDSALPASAPAAAAPVHRRDEEFCEEVARAMEAEPMHIVNVPGASK